MRTKLVILFVSLILLLGLAGGAYARYGADQPTAPAAAVGTGFTFQGQLKDAGGPVTGSCDMTFGLFDDALAGTQIGSLIAATVPVSNGQFTVMLNSNGEFGASAFDGNARWLEVAVQCLGDTSFSTLNPRQQISAAPYAHQALSVNAVSPLASPTWIDVTPRNTSPDPRYYTASAYDAGNDRLILFGGEDGPLPHLADVWVLENANGLGGSPAWQMLSPAGGSPPGRMVSTAVYDPISNSLIVHGGCAGNCSPSLSDTWILSNANGLGGTPSWTQLPSAPFSREAHTAVYDPGSSRMIIFGGDQAFAGTMRNDVWVLVDANGIGSPSWVQLSPTGTPPGVRSGAGAVYDPLTNRMIIFGGYESLFNWYSDVWILKNANGIGGTPEWIQLMPTGSIPVERTGFSLTYDPISNRITLLGGYFHDGVTTTYLNDAWVLTGANGVSSTPQWMQMTPDGVPLLIPRASAFGYSWSSNRTIIATGAFDGGLVNNVWLLTNANGLVR